MKELREAKMNRNTAETQIELELRIDGNGTSDIRTDCGFLNHMLTLFAKHGNFDLKISCVGDTEVDFHHTVEDIGICLGKAFADAAGEFRGVKRYAHVILPMDEALILCAADLSGRSHLTYELSELPEITGVNGHHILECVFKALARTLREALATDPANPDGIPSTKGVL